MNFLQIIPAKIFRQFFILLLLFSAAISEAQEKIPSFIKDSLDVYIERSMQINQIPGVSVAIIKDGKIILLKGYGVTELGRQEKVDENTLFMIGSNTKAFTATALSILDTEKKLSLDDKVKKWLPDFTLYDPWVANEANIRDLLCHRLGFETFQGDFMFFDSDLSTAEVRQKFGKVNPMHSFRSTWGYTNAAFMTAGEIIPKVTNQTWADYIRERILQPLGMTNTLMLSEEILKANNKAAAHTVYHGNLTLRAYR
jgi:CubicO group peptidase (beta-lactamase class C family)